MTHWYVHNDRAIEQRAKRLVGITLTDSGIIMRFVRGASRSYYVIRSQSFLAGLSALTHYPEIMILITGW